MAQVVGAQSLSGVHLPTWTQLEFQPQMAPAAATKVKKSCTWHVGPLHWTRVTPDQGNHSNEDEHSDQGDPGNQGDADDQGDQGD